VQLPLLGKHLLPKYRLLDLGAEEQEILISVVTVVRNGIYDIERTILSVIENKPAWLEYIVIDGASIDGTLQILHHYDYLIDHLISEPDAGIYDAMNKGIELSKGACVALLNCGDRYEAGALQIVATIVHGCKDKYYILAGGVYRVDRFGNSTGSYIPQQKELSRRFYSMPLNHPAMFVSRSVYTDITRYNTDYRICSDYKFVLDVIDKKVPIKFLNKILVTMSDGGISDNFKSIFLLLNEAFTIRRKFRGIAYCSGAYLREMSSFISNKLFKSF
jgi:glycosyltransferase involved in cell wall biosynthesis